MQTTNRENQHLQIERLIEIREELNSLLRDSIIPFWLDRSIDSSYGGYLTSFDEDGAATADTVKNIVTQSRMVWGFSNLREFSKPEDAQRMKEAANQGVEFLLSKFWDQKHGGFYWLVDRDGTVNEPAKLTYGQSFGVYALSEHFLIFQDKRSLQHATECFNLLQIYAADTLRGGYRENLEKDWSPSLDGPWGGDRKSLDIHMHLLEAFTTLSMATGAEVHRRKLAEVWNTIVTHMVHPEHGYGYNQFDLAFIPLPAIEIKRTWNDERERSEEISAPMETTSYGHNVELSWLADLALQQLGDRSESDSYILKQLLDHALAYGFDAEYGGVYRDGVGIEKALITDKEWWQNFESMVGFINGYLLFEDERYLTAFTQTWEFIKHHFINWEVGESRQLLSRSGDVIIGDMGNRWKGIYHTGRAVAESIKRLDLLLSKSLKSQ